MCFFHLNKINEQQVLNLGHDLFLSRSILDEAIKAFDYLYSTKNLRHQNKIFKFNNISIRL